MDKKLKGLEFVNRMQVKNKELPLPLFDLWVRCFSFSDKVLVVMHFHWKILRPYMLSLIPLAMALLFKSAVAFWIGVGLVCTEVFLSEFFVYVVLRLGLKKGGFLGGAKYVPNVLALQMICKNETR